MHASDGGRGEEVAVEVVARLMTMVIKCIVALKLLPEILRTEEETREATGLIDVLE